MKKRLLSAAAACLLTTTSAQADVMTTFGAGNGSIGGDLATEDGSSWGVGIKGYWDIAPKIGLGMAMGIEQIAADVSSMSDTTGGIDIYHMGPAIKFNILPKLAMTADISYSTGLMDGAAGSGTGYGAGIFYDVTEKYRLGIEHKSASLAMTSDLGAYEFDIDTSNTMLTLGLVWGKK